MHRSVRCRRVSHALLHVYKSVDRRLCIFTVFCSWPPSRPRFRSSNRLSALRIASATRSSLIASQTRPRWLLVNQPKSSTFLRHRRHLTEHARQQWKPRSSCCTSGNLRQVGQSWAWRTPLGCRGVASSRRNTAGSWRAAGRQVGTARMFREGHGMVEYCIGSHSLRAHRMSSLEGASEVVCGCEEYDYP